MHFILMSKNVPVVKICINNTFSKVSFSTIYNSDYLPLHVQYTEENPNDVFNHWFWHRCIPTTRDNVENFLKHTTCQSTNELAVKNRCLSLTDHYWIKKETESITWEEVNLMENDYSNEIGNIIMGTQIGMITEYRSPDLTTNGWLKKAWRREEGKDYLYKMGSFPYFQEPLNEVFCSELAKKFCQIDFVEYSLKKINGQYCSVCENFIKKDMEFVPAFSIYQTQKRPFYIEPYEFLLARCEEFGITDVKDKIAQMMSFDYLISNTDRHMGNFGFMQNINTLKFSGMAPLFDNGTSLLSMDVKNHIGKENEPFLNWQEEQIKLLKNFDAINIKAVKDMSERLFDILCNSGMDLQKVDAICKKYDERWNKLNHIIEHSFEKKLYKHTEIKHEDMECDMSI